MPCYYFITFAKPLNTSFPHLYCEIVPSLQNLRPVNQVLRKMKQDVKNYSSLQKEKEEKEQNVNCSQLEMTTYDYKPPTNE